MFLACMINTLYCSEKETTSSRCLLICPGRFSRIRLPEGSRIFIVIFSFCFAVWWSGVHWFQPWLQWFFGSDKINDNAKALSLIWSSKKIHKSLAKVKHRHTVHAQLRSARSCLYMSNVFIFFSRLPLFNFCLNDKLFEKFPDITERAILPNRFLIFYNKCVCAWVFAEHEEKQNKKLINHQLKSTNWTSLLSYIYFENNAPWPKSLAIRRCALCFALRFCAKSGSFHWTFLTILSLTRFFHKDGRPSDIKLTC